LPQALFVCDDAAEAALLAEKPNHTKYATGARLMRKELLAETRSIPSLK
jgi:hypothetical protein